MRMWKGQMGESTEGRLCCDTLWTWLCTAHCCQGVMLGPCYHCFVSLVSLFNEGNEVWSPSLNFFTYWLKYGKNENMHYFSTANYCFYD